MAKPPAASAVAWFDGLPVAAWRRSRRCPSRRLACQLNSAGRFRLPRLLTHGTNRSPPHAAEAPASLGGFVGRPLREMLDHEHVADFETMLRCTVCGNREHNSLRILRLQRTT